MELNNFVVVEVTTQSVTGHKTDKIVMSSDSELLCYRQALALQKALWVNPDEVNGKYIEYEVIATVEETK